MASEDTVLSVQKMQKYIEEHICDEITLKQLSQAASYSPWYAERIFKEITGKTPFDYIRTLRLTKAALKLRDENKKVIDVALDFVFDSHEGFTRAFSKEFGMPPKKYSMFAPAIQLFIPQMVHDTYRILNQKGEVAMSDTTAIFVQVIERPERKLLLKRGKNAVDYFSYCEEVGCDVWALLSSVKEALYETAGFWLPRHLMKEDTSQYVMGVELPLDYSNTIPDGFDLITLPPCKMMVFQGEPYHDDDFMEEVNKVWDAADRFNPNIYGYQWAYEEAPRFQLSPMGYRGYIEARPVKSI